MHRNTALVIGFLGIFAAVVVGLNLGKSGKSTSRTSSPSPFPSAENASLQTFTSDSCGVSVSYPNTLTKIDALEGGTTFINVKDVKDTIVLICQEDIPRVPLPDNKIETIQIGSVSAKLYHDMSQKDGTPVDKLIFTHPTLTKKDVYIAGYGETFNNLIKTVKIAPNK